MSPLGHYGMSKPTRIIVVSVLILATGFVTATLIVVQAIQSEAEKTRQAMSEAAESAVAGGVNQAIDSASRNGKEIAFELGDSAEKVFGEIREILKQTPRTSKPESSESSKGNNRTQEAAPVETRGFEPMNPGRLLGELFKTGREVTRSIDKVLQEAVQLEATEELQLGDQLHELISSQQAMIRDPELSSRLGLLAQPFLRNRNRTEINYKFSVLDDPEVNAFAHLGGYVYVNRGLLEFIDNEGELAFVLGHEIAHVDLRHCVEQMTYSARASEVAGDFGATLVQLGYQTIALGYTEDKEFEADARSYAFLGKDRRSAIEFLTKLSAIEPERPRQTSADAVEVAVSEIDDHFATHPPTRSRIVALQQLK